MSENMTVRKKRGVIYTCLCVQVGCIWTCVHMDKTTCDSDEEDGQCVK